MTDDQITNEAPAAQAAMLPCPFCGQQPPPLKPNTGREKWVAVECCCRGPEVRSGYEETGWESAAIEAWNERLAESVAVSAATAKLREELDLATTMLADWCVAVDENGTGWDDWDEHYKDAMYRPGPLRSRLDEAIRLSRQKRAE